MKTYSRLIILITAIISWGCQESTNTSSETSLQVSPPSQPVLLTPTSEISTPDTSEEKVIGLLNKDEYFSSLSADDFEELGWDLPDGGQNVKRLAEISPGGAFNPKDLENLPIDELGYSASWHELRFEKYGLEWDITGLYLQPNDPVPGLPTFAQIHGGSGNWYQFFVTPLNDPGLGQYLAQKIPVLLITIPGNYKRGGWQVPPDERNPEYLLDVEFSEKEMQVRNSIFTFSLLADGVEQLVNAVTSGPLVITGHSTGGEIQFLLKEKLRNRMQGLSFGWGTGGPAKLRRTWADSFAATHNQTGEVRYRPITEVRGRDAEGMTHGYIGPFDPFLEVQSTNIYDWYFRILGDHDLILNTAKAYFESESTRRPYFKQHIQDTEHIGEIESRERMIDDIHRAANESGLSVNTEDVIIDLFSTLKTDMTGYNKMVWTSSTLDEGHWDIDPAKARELYIVNQFRKENPQAEIRMLVYDTLMTHIGYAERPRQLAGGAFASIKWLYNME
jgi:hypothetical protein